MKQHGMASPLWTALAKQIYTSPVPPVRPRWRKAVGILSGTLKDAEGHLMDHARVSLKHTAYETRSDGSGFFVLTGLAPGQYEIDAPGSPLHGRSIQAEGGAVKQLAR